MVESKRSNFSVTCSRLSEYIKKNRSFADLGVLEMAPRAQEPTKGEIILAVHRPPTTLNLLPGIDASAETETETVTENVGGVSGRRNGQLTIFYGGKVMVFDDFPADKAADLLKLAGAGSSAADRTTMVNAAKVTTPEISMPLARRASLHRFLEKRKDRINSRAPYQLNESSKIGSTTKPLEAKSWLGLGQEISN